MCLLAAGYQTARFVDFNVSVVIQGWWKRFVANLLGTCFASKLARSDLMLFQFV